MCVCLRIEQILLHVLQKFTFTCLLQELVDLKLNTRASAATYHAYQLVQQRHSKNEDRFCKTKLLLEAPEQPPPRIRLRAWSLFAGKNDG